MPKIKKIFIDEFPPELGLPGQRLFVVLESGRFESVSIEQPQGTESLAIDLRSLAERLTENRR